MTLSGLLFLAHSARGAQSMLAMQQSILGDRHCWLQLSFCEIRMSCVMPSTPATSAEISSYMTATNVLLILGTICMLSCGQVLFKSASTHLDMSQPSTWITVPLVAALALYGVATLTWLVVLSRVPLSLAFPFYGLAFLLVPLAAALFLREPLRWQSLAGGVVILCGIAITAWGARS